MQRAAPALRAQVEGALARRFPSALTPPARIQRPTTATGIPQLDALLGGIPVGAITEVVGTASSGRTTLAMSTVAAMQRQDHYAAWIDAGDALDVESAAACGVSLDRLLWVRCGVSPENPLGVSQQEQERPVRWIVPGNDRPMGGGCHSPHPRSETRGLVSAVGGFLQQPASAYARDKSIGTPGVRNIPLRPDLKKHEAYTKEQPNSDRLPARRGSRAVVTQRVSGAQETPQVASRKKWASVQKPWNRMDQALRAADLVLGAGGFGIVVLDFGGMPPEVINRVPLATWFRFRAAAENSRAAVLVLTQHASARSSAELVLEMRAAMPAAATVMPPLAYQAEVVRQRFKPPTNVVSMRKPVQPDHSAGWRATQRWAGAR